MVGSPGKVLARSEPFGLDPLRGHPGHRKQLAEPGARETLKQLARLGGVFVVSEDGVALSAARRLRAPSAPPGGPSGSSFRWSARLAAAAHVTRCTDAAAVVVSEDLVVRVFDGGRLVHEVAAVAAEEVGAPASPASRGRAYRGAIADGSAAGAAS